MEFSQKILDIAKKAETDLAEVFSQIDDIAYKNTSKVLDSFRKHRISEAMLYGSTGYGYGDAGRDALDLVYADVFGAEAAFVRHNIVNGTQAIAIGLYGLLRPGDVMLSITGRPYDTLSDVIGDKTKNGDGSLYDFGVTYDDVALKDGRPDYETIAEKIEKWGDKLKLVYIQRSKGYETRPTFSSKEIGEMISFVKARTGAYVAVDNCYGEFCDTEEPTTYGADLIMGSLIKNPGGGLAESGGYIAGTKRAVELASYRLTTVGIGCEAGATVGQLRNMFKGFFFAPHVVAQAVKTAVFAAYVYESLGFEVFPSWREARHDIVQTVKCGSPEKLIAFCRGIQAASPIDSFVAPEPWAMPGYEDEVIMAAGAFTSGSSIELSADGPLRAPYTAYFQGGLTYESGKYAVMMSADEMLKA
ncbi:MAG: methionine gamma-lyase family protein [Clostridia bacterium]|nr:methionine gamma-lyase family protein [Clostridia bacterium]